MEKLDVLRLNKNLRPNPEIVRSILNKIKNTTNKLVKEQLYKGMVIR